jgi:hypothetical protein
VKLLVLVVDPPALVTVTGPLVAPLGTVAVTVLVDFTVKEAGVPLKATAVVPTKLPPLIVTFWPTFPLAGAKPTITGFGAGRPLTICTIVPASVCIGLISRTNTWVSGGCRFPER